LKSEFAQDDAKSRIRANPAEQIANVLLDQKVMARIGNVFKSEICFVCGIHPFRIVSSLSDSDLDCLINSARRLMAANVTETSANQIVTYTGPRRTTGKGNPSTRVWVYRRQGKECRRCGTAILMRSQGPGARSTYWRPQCRPSDTSTPG